MEKEKETHCVLGSADGFIVRFLYCLDLQLMATQCGVSSANKSAFRTQK